MDGKAVGDSDPKSNAIIVVGAIELGNMDVKIDPGA